MKEQELFGLDGAFPNNIPTEGLELWRYNEESLRAFAIELLNRYVPSKLGDSKFHEITQGRAEDARASRAFFSTCGELVMWLWWRLGYRGPALNRELMLPGGAARKYRYGQNMSYIRHRTEAERLWVPYRPGNEPKPGDVLFISNGPSATEHVCVYDHGFEEGRWHTFDAGQYEVDRLLQEARRRDRVFVGRELGDRELHGWVDLSRLQFVEPANLVTVTG